jgi:hypothetical protein
MWDLSVHGGETMEFDPPGYDYQRFRETYVFSIQNWTEDGGFTFFRNILTTYKTTWRHNPEDHNLHAIYVSPSKNETTFLTHRK